MNKARIKFYDGYADNIRTLRESSNMTVRELGAKLRLPFPNISAVENGSRYPSLQFLLEYYYFFNVSFDFLTGKTKALEPSLVEVSSLTRLSENAIKKLKELSETSVCGITSHNVLFNYIEGEKIIEQFENLLTGKKTSSRFISLLYYFSIYEQSTKDFYTGKSCQDTHLRSDPLSLLNVALEDRLRIVMDLARMNCIKLTEELLDCVDYSRKAKTSPKSAKTNLLSMPLIAAKAMSSISDKELSDLAEVAQSSTTDERQEELQDTRDDSSEGTNKEAEIDYDELEKYSDLEIELLNVIVDKREDHYYLEVTYGSSIDSKINYTVYHEWKPIAKMKRDYIETALNEIIINMKRECLHGVYLNLEALQSNASQV